MNAFTPRTIEEILQALKMGATINIGGRIGIPTAIELESGGGRHFNVTMRLKDAHGGQETVGKVFFSEGI